MPTWLDGFGDNLKEILDKPPYLIFLFVSSIIVIVSIITQHYFEQIFPILLYSIIGSVWRHAIKDIRGRIKKVSPGNFEKINLWLTLFYQAVNIGLVFILVVKIA